jgi:DNA-binding response OmpR family regulator
MKVLLVDDEKKFVSSLAARLSIRGIEADWATNYDEALSKARTKSYDIAVLDVKMPSMSGIDLKKNLEKISPGMKFIFITGHGSEEDYDIGTKEASFYIIKPFNINILIEKIEHALAE